MAASVFPLTDQVTEMGAVRTPYITGKARLVKAQIILTPSLVQADLIAIEADYVGYAAITFTACGPVFIDAAGGVSFELAVAAFLCTAATTPNDIWGGWVEDAGGNVLFAWQMVTPISMAANLDAMNVIALINRFGPRNVVIVVNGTPV